MQWGSDTALLLVTCPSSLDTTQAIRLGRSFATLAPCSEWTSATSHAEPMSCLSW